MKHISLLFLAVLLFFACKNDMDPVNKDCCSTTNMAVSEKLILQGDTMLKRIFIPNAFSPNNDGLNDFFNIYGNCIDSTQLIVKNGRLEVYKGDQTTYGWDGKINGVIAAEGVYDFEAFIKTCDDVRYETEGLVCLIQCVPENFIDQCQWGTDFGQIDPDIPTGEPICE